LVELLKRSLHRKKNCTVSQEWQMNLLVVNFRVSKVVIHREYYNFQKIAVTMGYRKFKVVIDKDIQKQNGHRRMILPILTAIFLSSLV
jgi:hypothetical protein